MRSFPSAVFLLAPCALALASPESEPPLQEVVITGTLRPTSEQDVPASASVLDSATLEQAGEQHLEDVIGLVPNLNWAGDTSRPRYFQIRGIGELDQYQGAPNPSVGFLIDDIDFSGLGTAATLFDIEQVDVLRGPQGTRYGANALGGLIYVQSAAPQFTYGGRVELGAGDFGMRSYGAVLTGPVDELDSAFRIAAQRYTSDGFYHNAYLHRDTDDNDELTLRARWRWRPSDQLRVDLTVLDVHIDNGYDAFSIDNSRTTQSDQPGEDVQHSTGVSLRADYTGLGPMTLTLIGTLANTGIRYGFDSDWGNPISWAPYTYEFTDNQRRDRHTHSLELRLASTGEHALDWLFGLYALDLSEGFNDTSPGLYLDPFDPTQDAHTLAITTSHYHSRNEAVFGELDGALTRRWHWTAGLRAERRIADYHDLTTNLGEPDATHAFSPVDHMWGGDLSLQYRLAAEQRLYVQLARGYKAGGFNLGPGLPTDQLLFNPESDVNLELGYKADLAEHRVRIDADVFYTHRTGLQLQTGEQLVPQDPTTFILYTANAASGHNYGLESSLSWQPISLLELLASAGLLNTAYHGLTLDGERLPDRALPHAPSWQAALSSILTLRQGYFLRLDLSGKGSFYYDVPALDPYASSAYMLLNAKAGVQRESWGANIWMRNVTDRRYTVRGFYFGDVPPDFPSQQYVQLGEPRSFGAQITYSFH
ncbi:MAG TPA: TonB-dependent receptor [Steroidobacteraceae bacterium]|nr:TonB-dependent receptor [Steroidobacteraceae bacterium]